MKILLTGTRNVPLRPKIAHHLDNDVIVDIYVVCLIRSLMFMRNAESMEKFMLNCSMRMTASTQINLKLFL